MKHILPVIFAVLTVALIAAGSVHQSSTAPASTPEGAVQSMFNNVKARNWGGAYSYVAGSSNVDQQDFQRDLQGRYSSLRTYSQLENVDTRVLHENDNEALVRTELKYSTAVGASLVDKNGQDVAFESSFDKMSHVLLPKEVSPYRIDFPGQKLSSLKSVRMKPDSMLVPASADPVIGVLHQHIEKDAKGRTVLKGELLNESGQTVNIPHVLATFYDDNNQVIWVSDGYADHRSEEHTSE